jgi:hypothetical protein
LSSSEQGIELLTLNNPIRKQRQLNVTIGQKGKFHAQVQAYSFKTKIAPTIIGYVCIRRSDHNG